MNQLKQYGQNWLSWLKGWANLDQFGFKKGYGYFTFGLVYFFNHGLRVLTGGANETFSRWFYDTRNNSMVSAFFNKLLNKVDDEHGSETGPRFPGSAPCMTGFRRAVTLIWLVMLPWVYKLVVWVF